MGGLIALKEAERKKEEKGRGGASFCLNDAIWVHAREINMPSVAPIFSPLH